jgi:hypothetical protein
MRLPVPVLRQGGYRVVYGNRRLLLPVLVMALILVLMLLLVPVPVLVLEGRE